MSVSEVIIKPKGSWPKIDFKELWRYREVIWFLSWRNISVKYKQTLIGIGWALLQPIASMVVFTVIFGELAKLPSANVPYSILTLTGVLPWQLFSQALGNCTESVVNEKSMVTKIYFPRLVLPLSAVLSSLVEFAIAACVLLGMMVYFRVSCGPYVWCAPLFVFWALLLAFGAGLWLSALNVRYRDVKYVVPFLLQLGWFLSPIGYSTQTIPEKWRLLYFLNPMASVIDGFRFALLGGSFRLDWRAFQLSMLFGLLLVVSGLFFFRRTEKTFADVI